MRGIRKAGATAAVVGFAFGLSGLLGGLGCGSGGSGWEFIGSPFPPAVGNANTGGGSNTNGRGTQNGGGIGGGGSRTPVDACTQSQARKFVRISMQNRAEDFVHYFVIFIARIDVDGDGSGAVCPDDIDLYTDFGYQQINENAPVEFGSLCIEGPALFYFHQNGQFRVAGGQLGSAMGPAQGSSPTFDRFFTSGGVPVPVPDEIIFLNPGSGEGQSLQVSRPVQSPCALISPAGDPICQQDSFYYVSESDEFSGTTQLGQGSGRRTAAEIQGTGCQCRGLNDPAQVLAPAGVTANNAQCNEFVRGGTITYVFLRDDQFPSFPQMVWRVTDAGGSVIQDFDDRAGL